MFFAPGQILEVEGVNEIYQPKGKALIFHSDRLLGTQLAKHMDDYSFFSYNTNEALHLSEKEKNLIMDCFSKIEYELQQSINKHSKTLIASNIELFLNYCTRFYYRQFITRDTAHQGIWKNLKIY